MCVRRLGLHDDAAAHRPNGLAAVPTASPALRGADEPTHSPEQQGRDQHEPQRVSGEPEPPEQRENQKQYDKRKHGRHPLLIDERWLMATELPARRATNLGARRFGDL